MQNIRLLAFLVITLTGCATFGTKTLYKSGVNIQPSKIGFTKLDGNKIVNKIMPITDSVFAVAFTESFKKYNLTNIHPSEIELPLDNPDPSIIAQICEENNLDALVISRLKFINISYSLVFIPVAKTWDTEVKMKVFDRNGNLLLSVSHNTPNGNSYGGIPPPERTIYDGTKGAIKRIAKEFRLSK